MKFARQNIKMAWFLMLCCLAQAVQATPLTVSDSKCLVLKQQSVETGKTRAILSKNAVRIDMLGSKAYLVAKAPSWRVVFFNPANKKAMDMPELQYSLLPSAWQGAARVRTQPASLKPKLIPPIRIGSVTYLGIDCAKFATLRIENGRVDPSNRYESYIYCLPAISGLAPQIGRITYHFFNLPQVDHAGLPVFSDSFECKRPKTSGFDDLMVWSGRLKTLEISEMPYDAKLFEYPRDFQKVLYELDVVLDDERRKKAEEAVNEMRFGER